MRSATFLVPKNISSGESSQYSNKNGPFIFTIYIYIYLSFNVRRLNALWKVGFLENICSSLTFRFGAILWIIADVFQV